MQLRTAPTKVVVSWDTISFQLKISYHVYRLSEIERDTFSTAVADAIRIAQKNNQTHDTHLIGYNFTLQLYESEIKEVEKMIQSEYNVLDNRTKQLHSAPSFVFVVEDKEGRKYVAKYFVNAAVRDNFTTYDCLLKKVNFQNCCVSLGMIESTMTGPSSRIYMFPYLTPPLPRALAKSCVLDFRANLDRVLHNLHSINISHMDVRLPNVCFSEKGEVMLTDFERSCLVLSFNEVDYGDCCTYPKLMHYIYIDFIQLMWMIFWIMLDDLPNTVVVYHDMDMAFILIFQPKVHVITNSNS
ncbi:MAG: hypothetical protein ORN98_09365 [Alphaproteobacteria bacterium]|nr:hypothetical protein [Alphaproteobacteria bacterium]